MTEPKKPAPNAAGLSETIRSLQSLLEDVGSAAAPPPYRTDADSSFETTGEFENTAAGPAYGSGDTETFDIDSHFDMFIPPALHGDDEDDDTADDIPTLSQAVAGGDIPVLKDVVQLPDGRQIPAPREISLDEAIAEGNLPKPASDAAEAAADAVHIILRRYECQPLTPEIRAAIIAAVSEILAAHPELEIPDSIV